MLGDVPPLVERAYFDQNQAIRLCLEAHLRLPGLILIYSGIDAWAWLSRPSGKAAVTRADFISWVDRYMLVEGVLQCSGSDLYGARCAILHSLTAESKLSEDGAAKWMWYAWGDGDPAMLQGSIDRMPNTPAVAVHLDTLFESFIRAGNRFLNDVAADEELGRLVAERATKYFKDFVPISANEPPPSRNEQPG